MKEMGEHDPQAYPIVRRTVAGLGTTVLIAVIIEHNTWLLLSGILKDVSLTNLSFNGMISNFRRSPS
jgi:hypothetical protein